MTRGAIYVMNIRGFLRLSLLLITLTVIYKAYRKWRLRKAIYKFRGKVVLITGASSGLGEGKIITLKF